MYQYQVPQKQTWCAGIKVRDSALAAVGCLAAAQPQALAGERAQKLLRRAMHSSSSVALKCRALSVLLDMLRVRLLSPCAAGWDCC